MAFSDIIADAVKGLPITEVLRERLAFAEQQFAAVERESAKLKLQNEELESENCKLRSELQQRAAQVHALEVAARQKSTGDRSETEQRILVLLASSDGSDVYQIAGHLNIGEQVARFHLSELSDAELIYYQGYINREGEWHLAQDGRRYLITRGLIQ